MIGSWRWNVIAAAACAAVIFLLAWRTNPIATAGIRAAIACGVAFAVTYAVRWMLGQALADQLKAEAAEAAEADGGVAAESPEGGEAEGRKGTMIDMTTPDDDDASFTPLTPPKLTKVESQLDPELLAKALRTISDK